MDQQALIEQCERARCACDEVAAALQTLQDTCAQTSALIAEARRTRSLSPCLGASAPTRAPIVPVEPIAASTEHELEMEVLRMMRTLLDGFPVQMQVKIVKALTARTMLVVAAQLQTRRVVRTA